MKTSAVGMTPLGLVELTRKKSRLPLDEFMLEPCDKCCGGARVSYLQLSFMLRDDLEEYVANSNPEQVYVAANAELIDAILRATSLRRESRKIGRTSKYISIRTIRLRAISGCFMAKSRLTRTATCEC